MAIAEQQDSSSATPHSIRTVFAAVETLSEITTALVPDTRITMIATRGDTLEVVKSFGVSACPVGVVVRSPSITAMPHRPAGEFIVATIDDVGVPEVLREFLRQIEFQSGLIGMFHPIDDKIYCVVIDRAGKPLSLCESDQQVLVAAIRQAADGIGNTAASLRAAQASANLETIVHLGVALSSVLDLGIIAAQTVEYASLLLGLPAVALLFRSESARDYTGLAAEGLPRRIARALVGPDEVAALESGLCAGGEACTPDSFVGAIEQRGLTNTFVTPLLAGDGRQAVLLGLDRLERQPTREERNAFQLLAIQSATAMRSAALYADVLEAQQLEARELRRTMLLNEVTVAATSSLALTKIADRVLAAVAHAMDIKIGAVYLYDEPSRQLSLLTSYGLDSAHLQGICTFVVADDSPALVSKAVSAGRIVTGEDLPMTRARQEMLRKVDLGDTQNVAIPLASSDRVVGTCSFVFERDEPLSSEEIALFRSIGRILAQAIKNSQLLDRTMEAARLSDALNVANQVVHSTLDIDRVMQSALATGVEALECEAAAIEILVGDDWVVRYQYGLSVQAVGMQLSREDASNRRIAAELGTPIAVEFVPGDDGIYAGFETQRELRSVLSVPLVVRTEVIGCVQFYSSSAATEFTDADIDFSRKFGSTVSLGYENATLYESQHRIAETLQQALLILPESLPGIEFEAYYHSATESTLVGGDFYDLFELDPLRIGILIGDIAGKGLAAAVLTSLVRNTIRAYAFETGKLPGEVLRLTNNLVERATSAEAFATVFLGILDRESGELCYASAGHTRAAILKHDATVLILEPTGPVLGAFADMAFGDATTCLGQHETLFLYTDGLTEARRDSTLYGEERLFADLGLAERSSARDLTTRVVTNVLAFARGHLRDDLAILAVARLEGTP